MCIETCTDPSHTSLDCFERYVLDEYEGGAGGPLMSAREWVDVTNVGRRRADGRWRI